MQNPGTSQTTRLSLELFHVQTNTHFELPPNLTVIRIGKTNDQIAPDINVSDLPDADAVSRFHAEIILEGSIYYLADVGSSNGTFLNSTRLEPRNRYPLNLGDRIDLGQEGKVTFIFQPKQHDPSTPNLTVIQPEIAQNSKQRTVDRSSKLVGLVLMVAGIVILTGNTQIGLFVRIPGVLLCVAGVIILISRPAYRNLGWISIALGIAIMLFTANVFASVSLLAVLASSSGKIWNYSMRSLKGIFKN